MTLAYGVLDANRGEVRFECSLELDKLAQYRDGFVIDQPWDSVGAGTMESRVRRKETELAPPFAKMRY